LGLYLLGAAVVAIGTFGSAVARSQVVAAVIGGSITVVLLLVWMLARLVDGALGDVIGQLALWDKHFTPFMRGTVSVADILYYLSITTFFLVLARNGLESRRWSS
jgi:ABC-2 type transport system permease protein